MIRPLRKRIKDKENFWMFRARLMSLYQEFEAKLEMLCRIHGVKINCWYSPSRIPQPQFMFGRVALSADILFDDDEFDLLFYPGTDWKDGGASLSKCVDEAKEGKEMKASDLQPHPK